MPYSQFTTITKVKEAFNLSTREGIRFLPEIAPISPSNTLRDYLEETLPIAIAFGTSEADRNGQRKSMFRINYHSCIGKRYIALLRQVRYIFRAETITGQRLAVSHQSRKRYIALSS